MDGIAAHEIKYLGIFLTSRTKSTAPCWHIIEQVFNLTKMSAKCTPIDSANMYSNLGTRSTSTRFWVSALARFSRRQLAAGIMSSPSSTRLFSLGRNLQMRNVANACESLATKAICADGG